jgi:hypothetical protein
MIMLTGRVPTSWVQAMGFLGLPGIIASRYGVLVVAQLVINVSLALWLYNEYVHNPFMQDYVSTTWSAVWPIVAISVGFGAGAFGAYRWRQNSLETGTSNRVGIEVGANLTTLDICPFCNVPLKALSEERLQCRNCRRYFKSSLPKVPA